MDLISELHYRQARAGSPAATEVVVEALRPRLRSMAFYYARCSHEDADDLLQEAWIGLLEAIRDLDLDIGNPEQYLIQRARWRLLDAIKYARVRRCTSLHAMVVEESDPGWPGDMDMVVAAADIHAFTAGLKSVQRAVLLCLLSGLTWREAGHRLGCSSANIAYHVRQIRLHYEKWTGESLAAAPVQSK